MRIEKVFPQRGRAREKLRPATFAETFGAQLEPEQALYLVEELAAISPLTDTYSVERFLLLRNLLTRWHLCRLQYIRGEERKRQLGFERVLEAVIKRREEWMDTVLHSGATFTC